MALVTDVDRAAAAALTVLTGIRAVSLGGSRAMGMADRESDTDLYAWHRGPLDAAPLRQAALAGLADDEVRSFEVFGPEDHWHVDGHLVEIVYLDLDEIEAQVRRARTEGLGGEVCATAFLHTAYASVSINDRTGNLPGCRPTWRAIRTRPGTGSSPSCRSWPTSSRPSCARPRPGGTGRW